MTWWWNESTEHAKSVAVKTISKARCFLQNCSEAYCLLITEYIQIYLLAKLKICCASDSSVVTILQKFRLVKCLLQVPISAASWSSSHLFAVQSWLNLMTKGTKKCLLYRVNLIQCPSLNRRFTRMHMRTLSTYLVSLTRKKRIDTFFSVIKAWQW